MKIWFFILMSPAIFNIGADINYKYFEAEAHPRFNAIWVGLAWVLALWAFYFI